MPPDHSVTTFTFENAVIELVNNRWDIARICFGGGKGTDAFSI